jgi:hypothetical protein
MTSIANVAFEAGGKQYVFEAIKAKYKVQLRFALFYRALPKALGIDENFGSYVAMAHNSTTNQAAEAAALDPDTRLALTLWCSQMRLERGRPALIQSARLVNWRQWLRHSLHKDRH